MEAGAPQSKTLRHSVATTRTGSEPTCRSAPPSCSSAGRSGALREEPPGSDRVPQLVTLATELEVAARFLRMGFPWCAFAVFLAALAEGGRTAALGLRRGSFNALYTPDVLTAAEKGRFGLQIVPAEEAWRGDLVLFDWDLASGDPADHVGRLVEPPDNGRVRTVDGNSGQMGLVQLRVRSNRSVRAFARDS